MKSYRYQLKELQEKLWSLNYKINDLLYDYREYQSFYKKTSSDAESEFYSYMLDLLNICGYEESRYNIEHRSLKTRIKENRNERNKLVLKIRDIKDQIKKLQRNHVQN